MEKKLFIASGTFLLIAIVFGAVYFLNRDPETKDNVNFGDAKVVDDDNDGLVNSEELQLGTNTLKQDTDNDTLSDLEEVRNYKTNPLSQDTDRDGYGDKTEIEKGFNPLAK